VSDPMIDELPRDLVALLSRESLAYPEDESMRAAVLAGVEATVGGPGGAGGGGSDGGDGGGAPPGAGVGAAVLHSLGVRAVVAIATGAFLAGGIVGGVVVNRVSAPQPSASVAASAPVFPALPLDAGAPVASEAVKPAPADAPVASASAPTLPAPSAKDVTDSRGDLTRERELLDAARASLSRSNPNDAIAAAERHAQRWPHGYLVEERDVVWVQALVAAGRRGEAERKALLFRRSFPNSVLTPAVDAALKRDEKPSTP
jgi:hypothetical protein